MCILIFRPSKFFGLSRRLVPTPGLTSKDPMQRVCVCACIYTHTYAPTPRQSREDIRQQPYLSLSKNQPPISETSALPSREWLAEPPHPHQVHVTQTMSEVNSISCTRNLDINLWRIHADSLCMCRTGIWIWVITTWLHFHPTSLTYFSARTWRLFPSPRICCIARSAICIHVACVLDVACVVDVCYCMLQLCCLPIRCAIVNRGAY